MTTREIAQIIPGRETSDGAGVKLRRSLGAVQGLRLDPFLMLDEFSSEDPEDYIAGFPPHPHRGFETVTYMLDGHMRHEDHMGNRGELKAGGVQWMTAGRGIIHSEMPQQEQGRMRGFQLWINLPAREKMKPASYRDIPAADIPELAYAPGVRVKVIAGSIADTAGPINGPRNVLSTDPLYLDVILSAGAEFSHRVQAGYNAMVYAYEGSIEVGAGSKPVAEHQAGVLSAGDEVRVRAGAEGARFILLAGRPIGEPVVQYGPFVMNTREEIEQARADYHNGTLATVATH